MKLRTILLTGLAAMIALAGCRKEEKPGNERWVTTENTKVDIDWDKIAEAYKTAEGPKEFETRVNEIYEGEEIISVSVHDQDAKTQVVTGFFDRNGNGTAEDAEKAFSLQRDVVDESNAKYRVQGYGHYAGYHNSMMWNIAGGMMLGSMMSSAFRPNYVPVYTQPYTTSPGRTGELRNQRSSYRAKNPSRFKSGSGRSYGSKGGSFGSSGRSSSPTRSTGRSFGGGRFGIRGRRRKRAHLSS
jgi:hypothetical protein